MTGGGSANSTLLYKGYDKSVMIKPMVKNRCARRLAVYHKGAVDSTRPKVAGAACQSKFALLQWAPARIPSVEGASAWRIWRISD